MDGDVSSPARVAGAASVTEELRPGSGGLDLYVHARWEREHAGLACGITAAAPAADFGLTTAPDPWTLSARAEDLCRAVGVPAAAMVRQVHGRRVVPLGSVPESGLLLGGEADGMTTTSRGVLLLATAADCVPVYLLDPDTGGLGLLHAGWRGAAAGVLEAGLEAMEREAGAARGRLRVHLGPGICGRCYEVGPEVLRAFGRPGSRTGHLDIRAELASRAVAAGVPAGSIGISTWCTRCASDRFHSHRGSQGEAGRMAAFLGWRTAGCP